MMGFEDLRLEHSSFRLVELLKTLQFLRRLVLEICWLYFDSCCQRMISECVNSACGCCCPEGIRVIKRHCWESETS